MHTEWEITPELAPSLGAIQGESSKCYLEFGNILKDILGGYPICSMQNYEFVLTYLIL